MKKIIGLLFLGFAFCLLGCQNSNNFENQIRSDLLGMLHNKVEVEQILVKQVTKKADGLQEVIFDCQLHFIDDLYKEDGSLAFKKGLLVKETGNLFKYSPIGNAIKLVDFEFGSTIVIME